MAKRRTTLIVAIAAGLALGVAGAFAAQAAIPGANNVITGCYSTKTGALRVIDTEGNQTCTNRERQVSWSAGGADLSALDLAVILGSNDFSVFDGGPRPDNNPSELCCSARTASSPSRAASSWT